MQAYDKNHTYEHTVHKYDSYLLTHHLPISKSQLLDLNSFFTISNILNISTS
jgi:hypothetical protein